MVFVQFIILFAENARSNTESDAKNNSRQPEDDNTQTKRSAETETSAEVKTADKPPLPRDNAADKEKQKRIEMAKYDIVLFSFKYANLSYTFTN